MSRKNPLVAVAVLLVGLTWAAPREAHAQGRERAAAAQAFDRGTQEALTENWRVAAEWFETADRLSPSPVALSHAIEARRRAEEPTRAATLALRMQQRYPNDEAGVALSSEVLAGAAARYGRIDVTCSEACTIEADGSLTGGLSVFIQPDAEHEVAAGFEHGRVVQRVRVRAGETRALTFEAPPPPPPVVGSAAGEARPFRFSRPVFFTAGAVTVLSGAVLLWSGLDTLGGVDAYEARAGLCSGGDPVACDEAASMLADGQSRERRTNALIGVTAGLAATTLVIGLLTDFRSDDDNDEAEESGEESQAVQRLTPIVGLSRRGGTILLEGNF